MAVDILRKTNGTISTNIILRKISPIGLTTEAFSPNTIPQIPPITIPMIRQMVNA
jgi:hypothetical protein